MDKGRELSIEQLNKLAALIRQDIFKIIYQCSGGHYASSLSAVEILVSLYFGGILNYDIHNTMAPDRDRFILSKGHGAAALYGVLYRAGIIEETVFNSYCTAESRLGGLASEYLPYGIEFSTGTLGHGLGFGGGIALNAKLEHRSYHTYVLLGDGECQEGSVWEAALCIAHYKLSNLTAVIDYNGLQASGRLNSILEMTSLTEKWKSFGWSVTETDGHDISSLLNALKYDNSHKEAPRMVIAKTIKGKGISFMEDSPDWHYRIMNAEQAGIAQGELGLGTRK